MPQTEKSDSLISDHRQHATSDPLLDYHYHIKNTIHGKIAVAHQQTDKELMSKMLQYDVRMCVSV